MRISGRTAVWSTALAVLLAFTACEEMPTALDGSQDPAAEVEMDLPHSSTSGLVNSDAPFKNWRQGFNHGTEGWFGMETGDFLGWCGTISQEDRGGSGVAPSAGRGYAVVTQGDCHSDWDFLDVIGGGDNLVGVPWAPGPGFAAIGNAWPDGGYTVELDIYLDPTSYEAVAPPPGSWVFECLSAPCWTGAVIGYSVSFMTLDDLNFHYLWIPVNEGNGSLLVDGHEVTEPGWYTFRFVFGSDDGQLDVAFELADRRGGTLFTRSMDETLYLGDEPGDYAVSNVGTGYAWFTSVSDGLELPIDEYRLQRGSR